jgi:hypothetical protein
MNSARTSLLPAPVALLDRARLAWLRALGPLAGPLMRSRELRVAVFGSLAIALTLALTALAPLWMLALGPIVLGVPHAAADVRYLVARPGLHRRPLFWVLVALPLAALAVTVDVRWGLVATVGAALAARALPFRRALVLALAALSVGLAVRDPLLAALVIAHAHNFVAIGIWLAWRRRSTWWHLVPLTLFGLGCVAILAGALDPIVSAAHGFEGAPGGAANALWTHLRTLAPGFGDPWGPRLVLLFAFTQAVHYAIWIRLVPEENRARETPRTWRATLREWRLDSGALVIAVTALLALAVAVWALFDLVAAREGYLRGVIFHGYLELAVIAWLVAEGRGLRTASLERAPGS